MTNEELPDTAYISVRMGDLYYIWRGIFPVESIGLPSSSQDWTHELTPVPIQLIRALQQTLIDQDRIHDPSVGIFDGELQSYLQMLSAWLHGETICPWCGGRGEKAETTYMECPHPRDDGAGPAHSPETCTDPNVVTTYVPCKTTIPLEVSNY